MPNKNELIPLLITRGAILYSGCSTVLDVGRVFSINAVNLALSDNDGKILNAILTDYVQIRDVSKEYNFDEGEVRLQFIFQKNFNPADVGEPVLS